MFKVGDKVMGNGYGDSHRIGDNGTIESIDKYAPWVRWSDGELLLAKNVCLDIVSRAAPQDTTPPRKMHPDDFVKSVRDFAIDNGFSVDTMAFKTQGGATVYYTNPAPAN